MQDFISTLECDKERKKTHLTTVLSTAKEWVSFREGPFWSIIPECTHQIPLAKENGTKNGLTWGISKSTQEFAQSFFPETIKLWNSLDSSINCWCDTKHQIQRDRFKTLTHHITHSRHTRLVKLPVIVPCGLLGRRLHKVQGTMYKVQGVWPKSENPITRAKSITLKTANLEP